jgi:oxygen-independent coproporphyrinogen-3 oxidase
LEGIFATVEIAENPEFSFEGHPNNTTKEHLQTLYDLGLEDAVLACKIMI